MEARSTFVKLGARKYLVISIAMVGAVVELDAGGKISAARIAVGSCSAVARRLPVLERRLWGQTLSPGIADAVQPTDLAIPNIAVNSLVIDPGAPQTLYAGTGEGYFNADGVRGAGIFKTTDGGATWTRLTATATPDFRYVNDLVVSEAFVGKNLVITRFHARGRGRMSPIEKPFSQLTVVVKQVEQDVDDKKAARAEQEAEETA